MHNNCILRETEEQEEEQNQNGALLNIDVKLSNDKTATLTIFENDIIEDRVSAFCKMHKLNKEIKAMLNQQAISQLDSQITELEESERQSSSTHKRSLYYENENTNYYQSFGSFDNMSHNETKNTYSNKISAFAKIDEEKQSLLNISDDLFSETITPKYIIQEPNTKHSNTDDENNNTHYIVDNTEAYNKPKEENTVGVIKKPIKDEQILNNRNNTTRINKGIKSQTEEKQNEFKTSKASKGVSLNNSPTRKLNATSNNSKSTHQSKSPIMNKISKSRRKSRDHNASNISHPTNIKPIAKIIPIKQVKQIKLGTTTQKAIHSPQKKMISKSPSSWLPQAKTPPKSLSKSNSSRTPAKQKNNSNTMMMKKDDDKLEIIKMKIIKYKEIFDQLDSDKDGLISLKSIRLSILNKDLLHAFTPILEELQKNGSQMEFKEFCLKVDKFLTMKALSG